MEPKPVQIRPGGWMPNFKLTDTAGSTVEIRQFRNRTNLIVIFTGSGRSARRVQAVHDLLDGLVGERQTLEFEMARVLVVTPVDPASAADFKQLGEYPFTFLVDHGGQVHTDLGLERADGDLLFATAVVDRFSEVYHVFVEEQDEFPDARAVIEWLEFIALQCPE